MPFLEAGGHRLEYEWIGPGPEAGPTLVLLHSGLGSLAAWKGFPAAQAEAMGLGALVYSRWGHGRSAALDRPRSLTFMHDEALETPHVFAEEVSIRSIADGEESYRTGGLAEKLARHHDDPDGVFRGWTDLWLDNGSRGWNIEAYLETVTCPVLVIQGEDDEYGTERQVAAIDAQAGGPVETLMLRECGHSPHQDQEAVTLAAMTRFVGRVAGRRVTAA